MVTVIVNHAMAQATTTETTNGTTALILIKATTTPTMSCLAERHSEMYVTEWLVDSRADSVVKISNTEGPAIFYVRHISMDAVAIAIGVHFT